MRTRENAQRKVTLGFTILLSNGLLNVYERWFDFSLEQIIFLVHILLIAPCFDVVSCYIRSFSSALLL